MTFRELFAKVDTTKSYMGINGAMGGLAGQLEALYIGKYNVHFFSCYAKRELRFDVMLETYEQAKENGREYYPKKLVLNEFINAHLTKAGYKYDYTLYSIKDVFLVYYTDSLDEDIDEFIERVVSERDNHEALKETHKKAVIYTNEELISEAVKSLVAIYKIDYADKEIIVREINKRVREQGCYLDIK